MLTPQEIDGITLDTAIFGGYDTKAVDTFLESLIEDYSTLYKENALLKSKMRILVGKLEEYRNNEASMSDAMVNAQKTCDKMVREAEARCAQMLAEASAAQTVQMGGTLQETVDRIVGIQEKLNQCIDALEQMKPTEDNPAQTARSRTVGEFADEVAAEIAANLRNLMDGDGGPVPAEDPKLSNLQAGYDPAGR